MQEHEKPPKQEVVENTPLVVGGKRKEPPSASTSSTVDLNKDRSSDNAQPPHLGGTNPENTTNTPPIASAPELNPPAVEPKEYDIKPTIAESLKKLADKSSVFSVDEIQALIASLIEEKNRLNRVENELLNDKNSENDGYVEASLKIIKAAIITAQAREDELPTEAEVKRSKVVSTIVELVLTNQEKQQRLKSGELQNNSELVRRMVSTTESLLVGTKHITRNEATIAGNMAYMLLKGNPVNRVAEKNIPATETPLDLEEDGSDDENEADSQEEINDNESKGRSLMTFPDWFGWIQNRKEKAELKKNLKKDGLPGTVDKKGEPTEMGRLLTNLGLPISSSSKEYSSLVGNKESKAKPDVNKLNMLISLARFSGNPDAAIPPELSSISGLNLEATQDLDDDNLSDDDNLAELIDLIVNNDKASQALTKLTNQVFKDVISQNEIKLDSPLAKSAQEIFNKLTSDDRKEINTRKEVQNGLFDYLSKTNDWLKLEKKLQYTLPSFETFRKALEKKEQEIDEDAGTDDETKETNQSLLGFYIKALFS